MQDDLCRIGVFSAREKHIIDGEWSEVVEGVMKREGEDAKTKKAEVAAMASHTIVEIGDNSQCHACGKTSESFEGTLKKCTACSKASYCTKDCQKQR
jgi:hypothetical protein